MASARYRIEDVTEGKELGVFEGRELSERGVEVRIAEPLRAEVIVVTLAK